MGQLKTKKEELIKKMVDEVNLRSEKGDYLGRHEIQHLCKQYINEAIELVEQDDFV